MIRNIGESSRKLSSEFLCPLSAHAFRTIHIKRHAKDEFFDLVFIRQLTKPFKIFFPRRMTDGFQSLRRPAEKITHRDADGLGSYIKTHDPHIKVLCA